MTENKQKLNNKYTNPTAINLISKFIKSQNSVLLKELCDNNNIDNPKKEKIINNLNKNYYPIIVQKKNREYLQCLLIKELNI